MDVQAFYVPDGSCFVATELSQGPWDPGAQHGAPVQALLTRCVEQVPSLEPMHVGRLTFDLLRPTPIGRPLAVRQNILREGKKVQLVGVALFDDDHEVARVVALRMRRADLGPTPDLPALPRCERPLPPPAAGEEVPEARYRRPAGFLRAIDLRRAEHPGSGGLMWVRAKVPIVAGEAPSPLTRLALAGDLVNLIGLDFSFGKIYTGINPDVTVQVLREPQGEFIAVLGDTYFSTGDGIGVSAAQLRDELGPVGHATCSQLLDRRRPITAGAREVGSTARLESSP